MSLFIDRETSAELQARPGSKNPNSVTLWRNGLSWIIKEWRVTTQWQQQNKRLGRFDEDRHYIRIIKLRIQPASFLNLGHRQSHRTNLWICDATPVMRLSHHHYQPFSVLFFSSGVTESNWMDVGFFFQTKRVLLQKRKKIGELRPFKVRNKWAVASAGRDLLIKLTVDNFFCFNISFWS